MSFEEDLKRLDEQTINHRSKIFGEHCRDKIKAEADAFRFKRSREDLNEKIFFENKATKSDVRKNELIEIHSELVQMLIVEEDN